MCITPLKGLKNLYCFLEDKEGLDSLHAQFGNNISEYSGQNHAQDAQTDFVSGRAKSKVRHCLYRIPPK